MYLSGTPELIKIKKHCLQSFYYCICAWMVMIANFLLALRFHFRKKHQGITSKTVTKGTKMLSTLLRMLHNTMVTHCEHKKCRPTWVEAVAGDTGALQPVGQLSGEQNIAQLATAVGLKAAPRGLSGHQVLLGIQQWEVNVAEEMQECSHSDHTAGPALLQPLQEEVSEQKMTQVVYPKCHTEALRSAAGTHYTWSGEVLQRKIILLTICVRTTAVLGLHAAADADVCTSICSEYKLHFCCLLRVHLPCLTPICFCAVVLILVRKYDSTILI